MLRKSGRVMVWSPPNVMTRGKVLPWREGPGLEESVVGARERMEWWPCSICWRANVLS